MITIKRIKPERVGELIRLSYEGDADILKTQHVKPFETIEEAVATTCYQIQQMENEKELKYYKVLYKHKPIGFFVIFDNFLFSFGINSQFRKKEILVDWWAWVKRTLQDNFLCLLYPHQEKAGRFLQKNGMVVREVNKEQNVVVLQLIN